ncbi:MAG: MFS transporter [Schleiferiaceae bacterium]|nr:MFS transporter [Schleiferiaceae bacterium]
MPIQNPIHAALRGYKAAFSGLSPEAWVLATVMLINRAGTMVLPFLSLYLTEGLGFTLEDTGYVMACFGAGSMLGSFNGGYWTDRIGSYRVQSFALFGGSILFLGLSFISSFWLLCLGVFLLTAIADMVRPANSAAVFEYAKPENVTKAFSLNRMAINLGFSLGPAAAGLIAALNYQGLFWADALTCFGAGILFTAYFRKRQPRQAREAKPRGRSPFRDRSALAFSALVLLFAIVFFQLVASLPLYYRNEYHLSEPMIGLLLGANGVLVVGCEMVFVNWAQNRIKPRFAIALGCVILALSFASLNLLEGVPNLFLSMGILSISEILAMPFMISWITLRAGNASRGRYLGMYAATYALGHILAPIIGTRMIAGPGFPSLWWLCVGLALLAALGFSQLPPATGHQSQPSRPR